MTPTGAGRPERCRWTLPRKVRLAELYYSPARLSYAEIARRMGITVAAVHAQVQRQGLAGRGYVRPRGPRVQASHRPVRPGNEVERKEQRTPSDDRPRPQLPEHAGWVKCLQCRRLFLSPHRVNIRRCTRCKQGSGSTGFTEDYTVSESSEE